MSHCQASAHKNHDSYALLAMIVLRLPMNFISKALGHGFALLACLLLTQCSTIDPARKAAIKKVVVACNVGHEITRHRVGLTVFGNRQLEPVRDARIKAGVNRILKEEMQGKFPNVVFATEEPPRASPSIFENVAYVPWARQLAQKYQADAVFMVAGRYYYPYAAPSYMTAEGMGIWHLGKVGQVQCYVHTWLVDAQGVGLGKYMRYMSGQQIPALEFQEKFADYTPVEQQRIIDRCLDEFRVEVSGYLKGIGL